MNLHLVISSDEIPPNTDPILDLIPILEREGFKLIANGSGSGIICPERYLVFKFPIDKTVKGS